MPESNPLQNALPPRTMLEEYRIESVLGAGGFGVTYLAHDTNLEKQVAIKEYLPADLALRALDGSVVPVNTDTAFDYKAGLEQFLVEARTLARFSHPNIVRVSRYFEANGTAYMVMEYERGESFSRFLRRVPQPDEAQLKAILAPLLDGLEAVHRAGFLHRDIKPSNIFIREDGSPVLLDFGAARLAVLDTMQDIVFILTPGYAPVELYLRSGNQGPWSDIYSVAGVLYRAVTGENPPDALSRLRSDSVGVKLAAARARYSGPFVAAIHWGLALEEKRRPKSVADWRGSLLRGGDTRGAAPAAAREADAPEPDPTRKYLWMALGVVILFVVMEGKELLRPAAPLQQTPRKALSRPGTAPPPLAQHGAGATLADPGPGAGLTREELARSLPHLAPHFDELDVDGDGRVSLAEIERYWQRQSESRKSR
jgi:serine/threonine protein kinase